ncbi:hypothetical protein [Gemmiger sp. An50]|uniref:dUTP diphosphatase n=1 Tax=Gemmiger sp. An50 TaxID=1965639 RepID=UPI000B3ACED8|nr:hypothetical protein [Gemmiger sp. An50]OUN86741.1 hypothetical protein B5G03_07270 [Gemmiger sp. An50]
MNMRINTHGNPLPEVHGEWIDLCTAEETHLEFLDYKIISLGVSIEIPAGYYAHIVPRSSTFGKWGVLLANSMGVIENDYCGDGDIWGFPAVCLRREGTTIPKGTRVCQFRLMEKAPAIEFEQVERLGNKDRGGYGSTGERAGANRNAITYRAASGEIEICGGHSYAEAVNKLCELEDEKKPGERYTFRSPNGQVHSRRGIELVLARLNDYEMETRNPANIPTRDGGETNKKSRVERMFGARETWNTTSTPNPDEGQGPYKGFLMVVCEECGEVRAFCSKRETYSFRCDKCGHETALENLRPMYMHCKCGKSFRYKTNATAEKITHTCLECKAPVEMELNKNGTAYVTIGVRR